MSDKIEFAPTEHEAVWIVPEGKKAKTPFINFPGDQILIFVAINFNDVTEKTIAKLILSVKMFIRKSLYLIRKWKKLEDMFQTLLLSRRCTRTKSQNS